MKIAVDCNIDDLHWIEIANSPVHPRRTANQAAASRLYRHTRCRTWTDESIRALLAANFNRDVLQVFDETEAVSAKTDLARFCVLHRYGGLVLDPEVELLDVWNVPPGCGVAGFRAAAREGRSWIAICTDLLWSRPGRSEWASAIEAMAMQHRQVGPNSTAERWGGRDWLGVAFAATMLQKWRTAETDDQWLGDVRPMAEGEAGSEAGYVTPDLCLVAMRTEARPDGLLFGKTHVRSDDNL